jgi:catechol 2,3-dioxygenase
VQNQGLGHVVFYVRNLERSLHFYRDLLGLQEIGPSRLSFRAAALTSGRTHHELLLIEVGDAPGPLKGHRIGLYHVAFKVGDSLQALREARDELRAAGIVLTGASDHTVSQSLYLLDPDENEVELYVDDPAVDWRADPALVLSPVRHLDLWGA